MELHRILECLLEIPTALKIQGTGPELGLTETATLPEVVVDFWLDERLRGNPIPWIISHRLPRREPRETQRKERQAQHLIAPPGASLLRN
eukprot:825167-Rhodomonas_salina.1